MLDLRHLMNLLVINLGSQGLPGGWALDGAGERSRHHCTWQVVVCSAEKRVSEL